MIWLRLALPILLIAGLGFSRTQVLAQEKQSDATWTETIAFIDKYSHEISRMRINSRHGYKFFFDHETTSMVENWRGKKDILVWHGSASGYTGKVNVFLRELSSAEPAILGIRLCTSGQDIWIRFEGASDEPKRERRCYRFIVDDTEMRPRLLKAFQHLAYLATERRTEQRRASDDPF